MKHLTADHRHVTSSLLTPSECNPQEREKNKTLNLSCEAPGSITEELLIIL